jgi:tetratricopeptide (TPR) repeat protein
MPALQSERQFFPTGRFTQSLLALVGVAACLTGVWFAGRIGASRLLGLYGMTSNVLPAVDEAIKLSPADPEGHYMRARALQNVSQLRLALMELEQATALQPRNFAYWMELGNIYDLAGRSDEALTAVKRAIMRNHIGNWGTCYYGKGNGRKLSQSFA